ncbi:peptidoglycan-binding protein [Lyngbya aestuarii]|uniref:peptidoglycan-binding protein n=1 Tax=Lyngbya aestuarii TaxID=118322 RepID=UPI00403DBA95
MEALAYTHSSAAYEEAENFGLPELTLFNGLNWKKFSSSSVMALLPVTLFLSVISVTNAASASGYSVVSLQNALKRAGYFPGHVSSTGYYGPITRNAVIRFQRANGLRVDGVAGPQTRRALGISHYGYQPTHRKHRSYGGGYRVATHGSNLRIRSGPGTGYRVIGSLYNGSRVSLSGRYSGGWSQLSNGGWVSGTYIR